MTNKIKLFFILILSLPTAHATNLPTPDEVQGIINACAAGRSVSIQASLKGSIKKWLTAASGDGTAKVTDIGGIISEIKDDQIKKEVFPIYTDCVIKLMTNILESKKQSDDNQNNNKDDGINIIDNSGEINIHKGDKTINADTINGNIDL
jgi:hypothetical protein